MKHLFSLAIVFVSILCCSPMVEAQSLMQTAKKAEQKAHDLKKVEASRYAEILDSRNLAKYNSYTDDYPKGKNTPQIRRRAAEITLWNDARANGSAQAFESYLQRTSYHWYDAEANEAIHSIRREQEKARWAEIDARGSIEAYTEYLSENPSGAFREEAATELNRLEGALAWNNVLEADSLDCYENFLNEYPEAVEASIAKRRIHEIKGRRYYDNGELYLAYNEFHNINRYDLAPANRTPYDEVMEFHEFNNLSNYSSEYELNEFLKNHPQSSYNGQVCNMIALAKARSFSDDATDSDYRTALSYATDDHTRKAVKEYVSENKKSRSSAITSIRMFAAGRMADGSISDWTSWTGVSIVSRLRNRRCTSMSAFCSASAITATVSSSRSG